MRWTPFFPLATDFDNIRKTDREILRVLETQCFFKGKTLRKKSPNVSNRAGICAWDLSDVSVRSFDRPRRLVFIIKICQR